MGILDDIDSAAYDLMAGRVGDGFLPVAKALIYPELTVEFAADVINGNAYGVDIWDDVCTLTGGWCNDANVFVA